MTTRKKITEDVSKIIAQSKDLGKDITAYAKREFSEALEQSRKAGSSIEKTIHNILDGIGSALVAANLESDELLEKAADAMREVAQTSSEEVLKPARTIADTTKAALEKALEKTKGSIAQVESSTKKAVEQAHEELKEKTRAELARLAAVSEALYDYSRDKTRDLSDSARAVLKTTAQKSKEYLESAEKSALEHSKELLRHGRKEVAAWLEKLAEKVKSKDDET